MKIISKLFGNADDQPAISPATIDELPVALSPGIPAALTAAQIRVELESARASVASLEQKLTAAESAFHEGQREYDAAIAAGGSEPDRSKMERSLMLAGALRRVLQDQGQAIPRLAAELAAAELQEATAAGRERIPLLSAAVKARLAEFEGAIAAAKAVECAIFDLLFDLQHGLKQDFATKELNAEGQRVRFALRNELEQIARRTGLLNFIDQRFETDGNTNLGRDQAEQWQWKYAVAAQQQVREAEQRARLATILAESPRQAW
jgi:hypothetical protein